MNHQGPREILRDVWWFK